MVLEHGLTHQDTGAAAGWTEDDELRPFQAGLKQSSDVHTQVARDQEKGRQGAGKMNTKLL